MASDNNMQKKCGFCGESIPANAGRCPYCGSILEVTFDSNYRIGQTEIPPVDGTVPGQIPGMTDTGTPTGSQNSLPQQNVPAGDMGMASTPPAPFPEVQSAVDDQKDGRPGGMMTSDPGRNEREAYTEQMQNAYRPHGDGSFRPNYNYSSGPKEPLSNGFKVFLTVLFTVVPGIGQLAGIIAAIIFMNSDGDSDRKSFGVALLVASLIMFVLSCIGCFIMVIAFSSNQWNQLNY